MRRASSQVSSSVSFILEEVLGLRLPWIETSHGFVPMSGHVKRNGPVAFQLRFGLALAARPCQTRLRSPVWQPSAPHCPSTPRLGCRDSQPRTQLGPAPGLVHARISAGGRVVCRGDRDSRALGHRVLDRMPPLAGWPFFPPKRSKKGICSRRRDRLVAHDAALRCFI